MRIVLPGLAVAGGDHPLAGVVAIGNRGAGPGDGHAVAEAVVVDGVDGLLGLPVVAVDHAVLAVVLPAVENALCGYWAIA